MTIRIGGILFAALVLVFWVSNLAQPRKCLRILIIATAVSELFLGCGYLFRFSNFEVNYYYLPLVLLFVSSFFYSLEANDKQKVLAVYFFFCLYLIFGLLLRLISNEQIYSLDHSIIADELWAGKTLVLIKAGSYSFVAFAKTVLFLGSIAFSSLVLKVNDLIKILKTLAWFARFFVIAGAFEFVFINSVSPTALREGVFWLFGQTSTAVAVPYYRGGLYSPLLACSEPSEVASSLFVSMVILLASYRLLGRHHDKFYIFAAFLVSALSLTLTGIVGNLCFLLVLLGAIDKKQRKTALIAMVALAIVAVMVMIGYPPISRYFSEKIAPGFAMLSYMANGYSDDYIIAHTGGSVAFRLYSMLNVLRVWVKHPLFGVGIGTTSAFSGLVTLLSNIGVIGVGLILVLWQRVIRSWTGKRIPFFAVFIEFLFLALRGGLADFTCSMGFVLCLALETMMFRYKGFVLRFGAKEQWAVDPRVLVLMLVQKD